MNRTAWIVFGTLAALFACFVAVVVLVGGYFVFFAGAPASNSSISNENTSVTSSGPVIGDVANPSSMFETSGVPTSVDSSTLGFAQGEFSNVTGFGTQAWIADPGKLLVGPDYPQEMIDSSGGAIERFSPANQYVCQTAPDCFVNLNEGGFNVYSGNGMRINNLPNGETITLKSDPATNWLVVIRGRNSDSTVDTDFNTQVRLTNYVPGHILFSRYPGNPAGGYVSEGQFLQMAADSHSDDTNCGANGCSKLFVAFYDVNTQAFLVMMQDGMNGTWSVVYSNFR